MLFVQSFIRAFACHLIRDLGETEVMENRRTLILFEYDVEIMNNNDVTLMRGYR